MANVALRNSIGVYSTTTTGGPTAPINGGSIPAVYAQAYQGTNGKHYVVLTNKSASSTVTRITQDGADLTNPMPLTFVTGTDPSLVNTGSPSDNVEIQTQTVTAPGAVTIPPYSVVRLEWSLPASISLVANAEGESLTIAPNTWVEIKGSNLAPAGDSRVWNTSDFVNNQMPTQLDGVSVTVNGKAAFVYYISPGQVNILTPPDPMNGAVQVVVNNGSKTAAYTAQAQAVSPSFFVVNGGPYVLAQHAADYSLVGPPSLYAGYTTPVKPGETVVLYANGFGQISPPVVSGAMSQNGTLSPMPVVTIGGIPAQVSYAAINGPPGLFQFNVVVPSNAPTGDNTAPPFTKALRRLPWQCSLSGVPSRPPCRRCMCHPPATIPGAARWPRPVPPVWTGTLHALEISIRWWCGPAVG